MIITVLNVAFPLSGRATTCLKLCILSISGEVHFLKTRQ